MKSRHLLLAGAVALALAACGKSEAPTDTTAPAAAPAAAEAPAAAPAEAPPAPAAAPAAASSKPAVVADCATTVEANDMMQYNADSITVPASCTQFTINLKHTGKLAANVMGHNVVIAKEADMMAQPTRPPMSRPAIPVRLHIPRSLAVANPPRSASMWPRSRTAARSSSSAASPAIWR